MSAKTRDVHLRDNRNFARGAKYVRTRSGTHLCTGFGILCPLYIHANVHGLVEEVSACCFDFFLECHTVDVEYFYFGHKFCRLHSGQRHRWRKHPPLWQATTGAKIPDQ